MERALRPIVFALFFSFPIAFAGIPAFWWGGLPKDVSLYEGVKIAFFFVLTATVWTSVVLRRIALGGSRSDGSFRFSGRRILAATATLAVIAGFAALHGFHPTEDALSGRAYSVSVLAGLAAFFWGIALSSERFRIDAVRALILWFAVSNFPYALAQSVGFDPVLERVVLPEWGSGRAFWTFGNPNSLAFFSVLALPAAFFAFGRSKFRTVLLAALLVVVLLTKSVSASAVGLGYLAYKTLPRTRFIAVVALIAAILASFLATVPEKAFSLQLRAALALDVMESSVSSWRTFLFGQGGGAVERLFSENRSAEVSRFVDASVPITHSHSFFLELALVFGVPFSMVAAFLIFARTFWKIERPQLEALSIFLLLSAVYLPSVAHLALLGILTVSPVPTKRRVSSAGTA